MTNSDPIRVLISCVVGTSWLVLINGIEYAPLGMVAALTGTYIYDRWMQ